MVMDKNIIIESVIGNLENRRKHNEQEEIEAKRDPLNHKFFRKINFNIDYDYLSEVLSDAIDSGLFVLPKTENELKIFSTDIISNFIIADVFPSEVKFIRDDKDGYYSKPTLAMMVDAYKSKKFPYPEFRVKVNYDEIKDGTPESYAKVIDEGVYAGCYRSSKGFKYFNDPDMKNWKYDSGRSWDFHFPNYYFTKSAWVNGKTNFCFTFPSGTQITKEEIDKVIEFLKQARESSNFAMGEINISFGQRKVGMEEVRYRKDKVTLENLAYLDESVKNLGGKVYFSEFYNSFNNSSKWDFDQLKKANECVDNLAKTIKDRNLSPFEAVLFVSAWSSKNLSYNNDGKNLEDNNTIVSAVTNKFIRCVGFSEFVNAVLNSAGFDKETQGMLAAQKISCTTDKDSEGNIVPNHCQSLIHLEDKQYGINGNYICDVNVINFIKSITEQFNSFIKQRVNLDGFNIKEFNSLCLKNLDEYRAMRPNYTIFPYSDSDEVEIQFDHQISASDIDKYLRIKNDLVASDPIHYHELLRKNGIHFSAIPKTIDGVSYEEYMRFARGMMKDLKKTQGKAISSDAYTKAFTKIIPILYPEFLRNMRGLMEAVTNVNLLNQVITEFIKASYEANEFEISNE